MVYIPKHAKQACDFTSQSEASDIAHSPQAPIPTSHRMKSNIPSEQAFCNDLAPVTQVRGGDSSLKMGALHLDAVCLLVA